MSTYIVKVKAQAFELYAVDAESEDEAHRNWHEGKMFHFEVYDAEVESVTDECPAGEGE